MSSLKKQIATSTNLFASYNTAMKLCIFDVCGLNNLGVTMIERGLYECAMKTFQHSLFILQRMLSGCDSPSMISALSSDFGQKKLKEAASLLISRSATATTQHADVACINIIDNTDMVGLVNSIDHTLKNYCKKSKGIAQFSAIMIREVDSNDKEVGEVEAGIILYNYGQACFLVHFSSLSNSAMSSSSSFISPQDEKKMVVTDRTKKVSSATRVGECQQGISVHQEQHMIAASELFHSAHKIFSQRWRVTKELQAALSPRMDSLYDNMLCSVLSSLTLSALVDSMAFRDRNSTPLSCCCSSQQSLPPIHNDVGLTDERIRALSTLDPQYILQKFEEIKRSTFHLDSRSVDAGAA